ncbi:hypothetical protein FI667_g16296, partial [Globisporangium splendens]
MATQEQLDLASTSLCLPLVLIVNFSLFQYLSTMFYRRHQEVRVTLLLAIAFLSFASLVPFAYPDHELIRDLNDISETCSVMTFLIQSSILARDMNKKVKLQSISTLGRFSELLVPFGLLVLLTNLLEIAAPSISIAFIEKLDNIVENASLAFIFFFRFYFLATARGF